LGRNDLKYASSIRAQIPFSAFPEVTDNPHLIQRAPAGSEPESGPISRQSVPWYAGIAVIIALTTRKHAASLKAEQLKVAEVLPFPFTTLVRAPNAKLAEPTTEKHFERAIAEAFPFVGLAETSSEPDADSRLASSSEINFIAELGPAVHPATPVSKPLLSRRFVGSPFWATLAGAVAAELDPEPATLPLVVREL
jgi:hypothetical protein